MSKKFWQREPVSKMLKRPKKALKKTFQVVRGRRDELEALREAVPACLPKLERGLEAVDRDFPIREGQGSVDWVALHPSGELVFLWVKRRCDAETVSKLLPDYDWIQRNRALWPHLFPQVLENRSLLMKVWILALEIDPDVRYLLSYLNGVRVSLFHGRAEAAGGWRFTAWEEFQKTLAKPSILPSSPVPFPVAVPEPRSEEPAAVKPEAPALLSREEIQDLISLSPVEDFRQEDEITDPFYELGLPKA